MKELVFNCLQEYERLAIALAKHPEPCVAICERSIEQRQASPLLQTAYQVKELEQAYRMIWQRFKDGCASTDVSVDAHC